MSERYEIQEKIGQGGIGAVYRAFDTQLKRSVAIKRMLPSDDDSGETDSVAMMLKEATTLSALQHPNIITVYDVGIDDDGAFVVMELLKGETLDQVIQRGVLTLRDFCEVVTQSMEALIALEAAGVLHRDLKPTNVMVNWLPSKKFQVKILDFSLAKFSRKPEPQTIDQGDAIFGSIYFMAPEQFERGNLDKRTDLYSMGCLYYFCLAGQYPFQGDSAAQVMASHLQGTVTPIQQIRADLPPVICQWVMWLINRYPNDRPQDAREAFENFQQLLASLDIRGGAPHVVGTPTGLSKTSRRLIVPPPKRTTAVNPLPRDPTQPTEGSPVEGEEHSAETSTTRIAKRPRSQGVSFLMVMLGVLALIAIGLGVVVAMRKAAAIEAVARLEALASEHASTGRPEGSPRDVGTLIGFFDSPDAPEAKILLTDLSGNGVEEAILAALETEEKASVKASLIKIALQREIPRLEEILVRLTSREEDPVVIKEAMEGLRQIGGFETFRALLGMIGDGAQDQYESNLPSGYDRTMEGISARLSDEEKDLASFAIQDKLIAKTGSIRFPLIRILGKLGTQQAFEVVRMALMSQGDSDQKLRTAALAAIQRWPRRSTNVKLLLEDAAEGPDRQRVLLALIDLAFMPGDEEPTQNEIIGDLWKILRVDDPDLDVVRLELIRMLPSLKDRAFAKDIATQIHENGVMSVEVVDTAKRVLDRFAEGA